MTLGLLPFVRRQWRAIATGATLVGGAVLVMFFLDIGMILDTLATTNPLVLLAAVLVYCLSWPVRGWRYSQILAAMDRSVGSRFLTALIFLSQTANVVLPARAGDGVRIYLLKSRRDVDYSTGTASLIAERVFDVIAICILAVLAIGLLGLTNAEFGVWNGGRTGMVVATAVGTVAVVLWVVVVWIAHRAWNWERLQRELGRRTRRSRLVRGAFATGAAVRSLARQPKQMGHITGNSLLIWVIDVVAGFLVLVAILAQQGLPDSSPAMLLAVATLAVCVGNLAKTVPLTQGGLGLYEAAFTGIVVGMTPLGVEVALTAAVLDHALKNAVTVGGGILAGTSVNAGYRRVAADIEDTDGEPAYF